jgi:hypothetical protein
LDRWSWGRLALGMVLLVAGFGLLGLPGRVGATRGGSPPEAVARPLVLPNNQTGGGEAAAGGRAQVAGTEGQGLRVRAEPSTSATVRAVLDEGTEVQVLEGPVAADGYRWYRVRQEAQEITGWVAGQFLAMLPGSSAGGIAVEASDTAATGSAVPPPAAPAAPPPAALALPAPGGVPTVTLPAVLAPGEAASAGGGASTGASDIAPEPGRYVRLGGYQAASPEYGMNIFIWREPNTTQRDLGKLRELGFTWQKTLFQWREIEGAGKGIYDWREADRVVAASTAAGIKVIARIDFPPAWATARCDPRANECPPDRFEDYADFIRAFTTRYGTGSPIGRVHAIEIWNEPNLAREWGNGRIDEAQAREYVRLLRLSYQAAKSVDPQMTIISAGLTPTGTRDPAVAQPDDVYLQWMYDAGAAAYFDVLGAHGAGYKAPPHMSPEEVAADPAYGGHASFCFRRVEQLREVMVRNGDEAKQVWLLEFGWSSDEVHPAYAWHRVTEEQKAQYIVDAYRWAAQNWAPWIGVMALWNLAAPGWTRNNEEYWWSITEPDGTPRPAYLRLLEARRSGLLP